MMSNIDITNFADDNAPYRSAENNKSQTNTGRKVFIFGVFLASFFPYSDWIWRNTEYLSVFSPNTGKYKPEKLRIGKLFHTV